ncbi:MFS transporter [Polycladidibacter hongkongensis]|uniref:MFS transporter n=1 Tax=Polycladidibacter hongkongensis TaxID=1647556 RepID=UPI00082E3895|nr:MFS transporter [Pseudovibrio hongkongensis]
MPSTLKKTLPSEPNWPLILQGKYIAATIAIALGIGSHAINGFISAAILPDIIAEVGGETRAYWVFSLFQITAILGGTLTGSLKSRFGAKSLYTLAAGLLASGSLLAGLAASLNMLLLGRALQGFAEGMIIALSYAVIYDIYPKSAVSKVFAMSASVWALAAGIGPVSAGYLTELWSWRAAYLVNLPLVTLLLALALFVMPAKARDATEKEALMAGLSKFARLTCLGSAVLLVSYVGQASSLDTSLALFALGIAMFAITHRWDRQSSAPLIPRVAFNPHYLIGAVMLVILLDSSASSVRMLYGNALGRTLWGLSITEAAYLMTILAFSWSFAAWFVAKDIDKSRQFRLIRIGTSAIASGLLLMALALALSSLPLFALALALSGAGYGISNQYLSQVAVYASNSSDRDRAAAFLPSVGSIGIAIGAALNALIARVIGLTEAGSSEILSAQTASAHAPTQFALLSLLAIAAAFLARRLHRLA